MGPKTFKSKSTSPGNREEINLYKKHYKPIIFAGVVGIGLLLGVGYVALGILGVL